MAASLDPRALDRAALAAAVPPLEGELRLPGLVAPMEVLRDEWGVPHIRAKGEADAWFALFAPAAVPPPALARLREVTLAAIAREPVRARTTEVGMTVNIRPAAEMTAFLREDIARWAEVIRTANVKPE